MNTSHKIQVFFLIFQTSFPQFPDKGNTTQEGDESDWKGGGGRGDDPSQRRSAIVRSPTLGGGSPTANGGGMQNNGKVKFDPPKVPVIFVLGGPGSGKVTHCDTLMQERRGVTHINMMDLLQQYAIGNGESSLVLPKGVSSL